MSSTTYLRDRLLFGRVIEAAGWYVNQKPVYFNMKVSFTLSLEG